MSLLDTLSFIVRHPLSQRRRVANLWRFAAWQLRSLWAKEPLLVPFVGGARLRLRRGLTGATGNVYVGLHEFEDMAFVLHALRSEDLFVDIGANVGSYTVLAGAVVGAECLAIEPVPATFQWLLGNVKVNGIGPRVTALNLALGSEPGELRFTGHLDAVNHVVMEREDDGPNCIRVPVRTLDAVLGERVPFLIKMDVEGFETEVVLGGGSTLADPGVHGVLMELNGSGRRYGFDEAALGERMVELGFQPYRYRPFERGLEPRAVAGGPGGNVLFLRNLHTVRERVAAAAPFDVRGRLV